MDLIVILLIKMPANMSAEIKTLSFMPPGITYSSGSQPGHAQFWSGYYPLNEGNNPIQNPLYH